MPVKLPNVKTFFLPDPGHVICDTDLDRADLQVVVWEANDDDLKQKLREGVDLHKANAADVFGGEISSITPKQRQFAKAFIHGTNYGGSPRTMARAAGCTVHEAESAQRRWFQAHPGIKDWHERVMADLQSTRTVWNKFGFRRYFFDRIEGILPQALAWVPQSTVAVVTNQGIRNLYRDVPEVDVLLQVHDSVVWQVPHEKFYKVRERVRQALEIQIPYDDPLTIPVGLKASDKSWGHCKDVAWDGMLAA